MSSAKDFYDYADEHFGWAETARTERERAIFFQMAAAWLEVAQRCEETITIRFEDERSWSEMTSGIAKNRP